MVKVTDIGLEDGDPNRVFGVIQDVAIDRSGKIYVLDALARSIRVFTRDGRFVSSIGRMGRGPGEFFIPVAMTVDAQDRLYVLDQGNARVDVFAPARSGGRSHTASFPVPFQPYDLCAVGDRLYVLGLDRGRVVHVFTLQGRRLESFGDAPGGTDALLAATLGGGVLECRGGSVVFVPRLTGDVRVYSPSDGRLAWSAPVPGYNPVRLTRNPDGTITLRMGRNRSHDLASGAVAMGRGYSLVQVGSLFPRANNGTEFREVRSYVASPHNQLLPLPGRVPRVVAVRDGYAVAVRSDPFPLLTVYTLRSWEEAVRR
ncbi:MAG TPA: 6-bladed beta-propeller [Longimicrobium sp.]|jgi:hypothetical protein|nr:6-bladed beta-propeller [Longimicrobium sp.]